MNNLVHVYDNTDYMTENQTVIEKPLLALNYCILGISVSNILILLLLCIQFNLDIFIILLGCSYRCRYKSKICFTTLHFCSKFILWRNSIFPRTIIETMVCFKIITQLFHYILKKYLSFVSLTVLQWIKTQYVWTIIVRYIKYLKIHEVTTTLYTVFLLILCSILVTLIAKVFQGQASRKVYILVMHIDVLSLIFLIFDKYYSFCTNYLKQPCQSVSSCFMLYIKLIVIMFITLYCDGYV